eukprot:scaffold7375_cov268-Pinguiococcus_pyrenoidosus.AAC.44
MNASSRAALMAKLGNRAGLPPPAMPPVPTMPAMPAIPAPVVAGPAPAVPMPAAQAPAAAPAQAAQTKLLIVMNMFDPAQEASEAGPNWDQEIREDVEQEVSKFGTPVYVQVDKVDPKGCVYIAFSEVQGAVKTSEGLNGRFFAGKQIVTQFLSPTAFLSKCPSAAAMVSCCGAEGTRLIGIARFKGTWGLSTSLGRVKSKRCRCRAVLHLAILVASHWTYRSPKVATTSKGRSRQKYIGRWHAGDGPATLESAPKPEDTVTNTPWLGIAFL